MTWERLGGTPPGETGSAKRGHGWDWGHLRHHSLEEALEFRTCIQSPVGIWGPHELYSNRLQGVSPLFHEVSQVLFSWT